MYIKVHDIQIVAPHFFVVWFMKSVKSYIVENICYEPDVAIPWIGLGVGRWDKSG